MARKKRVGRKKHHRLNMMFSSAIVIATLGLGNWFSHQPSAWRSQFGALEPVLEHIGSVTAHVTDVLGLTGEDVWVVYERDVSAADGPLPFGMPEVVDTRITPGDQEILRRKGYWVAWSPSLRVPLWSAYAVPTKKIVEHAWQRPGSFEKDDAAKNSPTHSDYTGSNYDRGHMAPNHVIATRYGRAAQLETFLMSNIAPQEPDLNRNAWRKLEEIVANDLSEIGETVWVITGIVPDRKEKVLPKGAVHIPKGFYKVIATIRDRRLYTIGVYMPQETAKYKSPRYCFRSIDEIEAMTGMDFFSSLSDDREHALESIEVTRFWSTGFFN